MMLLKSDPWHKLFSLEHWIIVCTSSHTLISSDTLHVLYSYKDLIWNHWRHQVSIYRLTINHKFYAYRLRSAPHGDTWPSFITFIMDVQEVVKKKKKKPWKYKQQSTFSIFLFFTNSSSSLMVDLFPTLSLSLILINQNITWPCQVMCTEC